jgi:hypothetical protein
MSIYHPLFEHTLGLHRVAHTKVPTDSSDAENISPVRSFNSRMIIL